MPLGKCIKVNPTEMLTKKETLVRSFIYRRLAWKELIIERNSVFFRLKKYGRGKKNWKGKMF